MFIVLVTDFANVQAAHGPFATREAAHDWAEHHLRDDQAAPVYRVFELNPAGPEPAPNHRPG